MCVGMTIFTSQKIGVDAFLPSFLLSKLFFKIYIKKIFTDSSLDPIETSDMSIVITGGKAEKWVLEKFFTRANGRI